VHWLRHGPSIMLSTMATINPFQSPPTSNANAVRSLSGYTVVAFPRSWHGFSRSKAWLEMLQKHATLGDRLVASCAESHDRYYFVFQYTDPSDGRKRPCSYSIVASPRAKSLSKTKCGKLTEFMAAHFPSLEPGWTPVAHISNHQLVLSRANEIPPEQIYDEYLVAHLPPVWWRTLFGVSYLRVIGDEINKIATSGYDVITFLGDDRYLFGKRKPQHHAVSQHYQLIFIGNLFNILIHGYASTCQKMLDRRSEQGWELVTCDHSGFLFRKAN